MHIRFLGGANEVGASCTLIEIQGQRILVDAGIRMGSEMGPKWPDFSSLSKPDALLLTHAHSDHTAALPLLAKEGKLPEKVYCTSATREIAAVLFHDAQRREERSESPEYGRNHVDEVLRGMVQGEVQWQEPVQLCDGVTAKWTPAGHILGAGMIYIEGREERILMTGDVSVADQLTMPGMVIPEWCQPDVMVMESTYGDRCHEDRAQQEAKLVQDVTEVIGAGGKVLIPAFAVARSQEVIRILKGAMERERMKMYVDGMVTKVNDVYSHHIGADFYSEFVQKVHYDTQRDHISSVSGPPCCIVASSGMLNGGRSNYYAKHLARDPKNLIAITGYQAEGTSGDALLKLSETRESQDREWKLEEETSVLVECEVNRYSLSAHADRSELTRVVERARPRTLFLVHGNAKARNQLKQSVQNASPSVHVELPKNGVPYREVKREGVARGRPQRLDNILRELAGSVRKVGLPGPFRARELAEMWFATDKTTPTGVRIVERLLSQDQDSFVSDSQHHGWFHLKRIA